MYLNCKSIATSDNIAGIVSGILKLPNEHLIKQMLGQRRQSRVQFDGLNAAYCLGACRLS